MIVLGGILILGGFGICILVRELDQLFETFIAGIFAGLCFVFGLFIVVAEVTYEEQTEFKYPVNEYKLEYEVLTKGEQVDSTYVITKIE